MKRKCDEQEGSAGSKRSEIDRSACQVPNNEEEWLTLDFGGLQLFVHPESGRVCDAPDGRIIGEFDADQAEVKLYAEDGEMSGASTPQRCAVADRVLDGSPRFAEQFKLQGLLKFDHCAEEKNSLLRAGLVETLKAELEVLLAVGSFSVQHTQASSVRTDRVVYLNLAGDSDLDEVSGLGMDLLDAVPCPPCCLEATQALEGVVARLNENLGLGFLKPRRIMASCYEGGACYTAHRDNEPAPDNGTWRNRRGLTAILYVNDCDWPEERGGCLRCYVDAKPEDSVGDTATQIVDVWPRGGQVVLFDSTRLLHEVRPTFYRRLALSIWFVTSSLPGESGEVSEEADTASGP